MNTKNILILSIFSVLFVFPVGILAYGGGGGGGIMAPWIFFPSPTPTPTPTQMPTPNPYTLSESGQYYKIGNNVFENTSDRHIALNEFHQLGLNFGLLPSKTSTVNGVVIAAKKPRSIVAIRTTPVPSIQPSASLNQLQANISQNVPIPKVNIFKKIFNWVFHRK